MILLDGAWVVCLCLVGAVIGGLFGILIGLIVIGVDGVMVDLGVVVFDCAGIGCDSGLCWLFDGLWLFGLCLFDELFVW